MTSCTRVKSPGLYGHLLELYLYILHLFGDLLTNVYHNRQQNGSIPSDVSHGVVVLLRKDPNKGDQSDHFRPMTLKNGDYKIWAKMLAKRLALVVGKLVGNA